MTMSKRRIGWSLLVCYGAAAMLFGCQRETIAPAAQQQRQAQAATATAPADARTLDKDAVIPLIPDVLTRSAVGSQLGPDGTVAAVTTQFEEGDPVYVSMWFKEAPPGLVVSARWTDRDGKELSVVRKDAAGAKVVTLQLHRKLTPGKHRVEGFWGGNVVLEQEVEVRRIED